MQVKIHMALTKILRHIKSFYIRPKFSSHTNRLFVVVETMFKPCNPLVDGSLLG